MYILSFTQGGRVFLVAFHHKVDKTEGASEQFSIDIFNFLPYGQLRAVREKKFNYEL